MCSRLVIVLCLVLVSPHPCHVRHRSSMVFDLVRAHSRIFTTAVWVAFYGLASMAEVEEHLWAPHKAQVRIWLGFCMFRRGSAPWVGLFCCYILNAAVKMLVQLNCRNYVRESSQAKGVKCAGMVALFRPFKGRGVFVLTLNQFSYNGPAAYHPLRQFSFGPPYQVRYCQRKHSFYRTVYFLRFTFQTQNMLEGKYGIWSVSYLRLRNAFESNQSSCGGVTNTNK